MIQNYNFKGSEMMKNMVFELLSGVIPGCFWDVRVPRKQVFELIEASGDSLNHL